MYLLNRQVRITNYDKLNQKDKRHLGIDRDNIPLHFYSVLSNWMKNIKTILPRNFYFVLLFTERS
jgi:hypothetical protein